MEAVTLALAGSATALATGLGALPVSHLGARAETLRPALWGLTVGLMTVASVVGLLLPALDDGSPATAISRPSGLKAGGHQPWFPKPNHWSSCPVSTSHR